MPPGRREPCRLSRDHRHRVISKPHDLDGFGYDAQGATTGGETERAWAAWLCGDHLVAEWREVLRRRQRHAWQRQDMEGLVALTEVMAGALAGAVCGTAATFATTYFQMRMNRKEQQYTHELAQRAKRDDQVQDLAWEGMLAVWKATHEGAQELAALQREHGAALRPEFYEKAAVLGVRLNAQSMIMPTNVISSMDYSFQIYDLGRILRYLPDKAGHRPDGELARIAREVISHAQWVCAAYLVDQSPPPEPMPRLAEYQNIVCPGPTG